METWIYVVVVKYLFVHNNIEYASAIDSHNISLWASIEEAYDIINRVKQQLEKTGYLIKDSAAPETEAGTVYWCRMERNNSRAAVLEVLRKSVAGNLFQVGRG